MKKLLLFAALVLGMASCQTEPEGLDVVVGGEQEVMLNVSLPESTRMASSAGFNFNDFDSNSQYDLRFILEIAHNGKVVRTVKTSNTTTATFPVRLAPDREYTFTVWADLVLENTDAADLYYNILSQNKADDESVLNDITFNTNYWAPNVEARDAYTFTTTKEFKAGETNLTMNLTRPFAKVRVVATDIENVTKFDIVPDNAVVTYNVDLYTSFNAVTGVAGDAEATAFEYTINPEAYEDEKEDDQLTELTVFADYIFVPADGIIKFDLVINDGNAEIKENNFNTAIPVVANKVTSIVGDVLTHGGNVSINVNSGIGQHETINYVDSATTLQEIINETAEGESANITLGGDIDLNDLLRAGTSSTRAAEPTYGLGIPAGRSVVLDLKGFTISQSKTQTTVYSMIDNCGTLTIKDSSANKTGKISYADNGQGGNYGSNTINNSGVLTIDGGTIENNSSATVASNGFPHPIDNSGTLVINDGTFTNNANYSSMRIWCTTDDNTIITINGGTFNGSIDFQTPNAQANKGTLTINGGTFNADTYTKCAVRLLGFGADVDEMNGYILGGHFDGAIALRNWSGSELNSKVFDITAGTFTTAAKEGTDIALVNDDYAWVETENGLWTLELKKVIAKIGETEYRVLQKAFDEVVDNGTIVLQDNVTLNAPAVLAAGKKATLNLNGKTIINTNASENYGESEGIIVYGNLTIKGEGTIQGASMAVWARGNAGAEVNIYGGTFLGCQEGLAKGGRSVVYASSGNVINIYGGMVQALAADKTSYANKTEGVYAALNVADNNGMINVYGGSFYKQNPAAPGTEPAAWNTAHPYGFVAKGYGATEDNGVWTVAKAYEITDNVYTITSAAGLFWVANEVNSGANYFEGKTIKLGVDIDLNNAEWTPIGSAYKDHGFMGNFDGNGYSIKNLKMTKIAADADGYVYAGLFGVTEGDENNENYIKNLVIENVNIALEGDIVAAAIAYPYYTTLENITVKGNVSIKGGNYTSGVLAYTRRLVNANNIVIAANAGSIEGTQTVGGVISDIQTNGGLVANYSNFVASGLTIKAARNVGGISGIIAKQTLKGAKVENVTIESEDARKGSLAGALGATSTINDAVVNNVTGVENYVGATYKDGSTHTITINGVEYEYLANGLVKVNGEVRVADAESLTEALAGTYNIAMTQDIRSEATTTAPYGNKYSYKMNGGVLNGNGHELYMECYGDDYGIMTAGGTIKNLTIKEGCRAVMIMYPQDDIILDNVNIGGDGVLYPINTGEKGAEGVNLVVTNSTLAGWTSYGLIESASFTDVKFEQGTYYTNIYGRVLKPYVNTTLTNCSFVAHMNLDLSALGEGHTIVMKGCTVDGQAVTAETFTIPTTNAQYDTELFTIDLPSWATSVADCVIFE